MNRQTAVNFLREHPELLKASDPEIVRALQDAGIISRSTRHYDCNIRSLVTMAASDSHVQLCPTCGRAL